MAQIYRQIGKRFLKRFQTDNEFIKKKDVGSDGDNIVVTADADRLARADFCTELLNIDDLAFPSVISPDTVVLLSASPGLPGIFDPASKYLPSFINIHHLHMSISCQFTSTPSAAALELEFRITALPQLVGGTASAVDDWFDRKWFFPVTADEFLSFNESYQIGLRIPVSDVTVSDAQADGSRTFEKALASVQTALFGAGFSSGNAIVRRAKMYMYWSAEF